MSNLQSNVEHQELRMSLRSIEDAANEFSNQLHQSSSNQPQNLDQEI